VGFALGRLHGIGARESTYTWQFHYFHQISENLGISGAWLNEGHLTNHHQDGLALQAWFLHRMKANKLQVGAGLGLYRYFDTNGQTDGQDSAPGYRNDHGARPLLGLRALYPGPGGAWAAFLQLNRTLGPRSPQTQAILAGTSFRFGEARAPDRAPGRGRPAQGLAENEMAFLFGRTILNSFRSETTELFESYALEYRRRLGRHLAFSVAYADEGGLGAARRDGLSLQAWAAARSASGAWMLALGWGPYVTRVLPEPGTGGGSATVRTSPRYSILAGRHLGGHWGARFQWNRTLTRYHRDTDVLLAGIAYLW
jgi:hypothetical protein